MDYDDSDSDDDTKLQIVESSAGGGGSGGRTLVRSLSAVESVREDYQMGTSTASDAVESLLLLGQGPVLNDQQESKNIKVNGNQRLKGFKYSNSVDQRMMVNYYQRMRERNNEASKRCRLKRRIKQDTLEKTRMMLENYQDVLKNRVSKLHKIKEILNDACRSNDKEDCLSFCNLIKNTQREMPDYGQFSNQQLLKKSRFMRETNLEELVGAQAPDLSELPPLKRGPRKVDNDIGFSINTDILIKPESPGGALDLSAGSKTQNHSKTVNLIKIGSNGPLRTEALAKADSKPRVSPVTYVSPNYVALAPKATNNPLQLPGRTVIVDNPKPGLPSNLIPIIQNGSSSKPGLEKTKSTISFGNINGTTTILLTPLGGPSTVLNLPLTPAPPCQLSPARITPNSPPQSSNPPLEIIMTKPDPELIIKSEPEVNIVEMEAEESPSSSCIKTEQPEMSEDPTVCCAAVLSGKEDPLSCSSSLLDLNSLTHTLDLVSLEQRSAGDLTAAEKNIIKSRLGIAFWKAEETASFICSFHRGKLLEDSNMQNCSICNKRRSRKLDYYIITYRMAVEFYMTNGQFLSIGQLVCSGCKVRSLKGLDFSNSRIIPEVGHPLNGGDLALPIKKEAEEEVEVRTEECPAKIQLLTRDLSVHRDVVLPAVSSAQGKLATIQPIQPLPQRPQARIVATSSLNLASASASQQTAKNNSDGSKSRQDLHTALTALNPDFRPLGFTITSLSSCSEGVMRDSLAATKAAITTILTSIAPGQEASLWNFVKPQLDKMYPDDIAQCNGQKVAQLTFIHFCVIS